MRARCPALSRRHAPADPATPRKVRAEAEGDGIAVAWLPGRESFIDHYRVYRTRRVTEDFSC